MVPPYRAETEDGSLTFAVGVPVSATQLIEKRHYRTEEADSTMRVQGMNVTSARFLKTRPSSNRQPRKCA